LLNGHPGAGADAAVLGDNLLRGDRIPVTHATLSPPASAQVQVAGLLYPYNAIDLQKRGQVTVLEHSGIYREYSRAVNYMGHQFFSAAVPEMYFKNTFPFLFVKATKGPKEISTGDIIVRLPGHPGAGKIRIMWGTLKKFVLAANGSVIEYVSSK
jgi:hypothetical protein